MIKAISQLKNFGIFHDFSERQILPEFKRFNLIYGWNRSGKTTFSRIFSGCEKKSGYDENKFKQFPKDGEFELITANNIKIKSKEISTNDLSIKVFNQDFIDENISFETSDSCNPIIFVSEEDIESKTLLEKLKSDKSIVENAFLTSRKDRATKEEIKNSFLTGLGREIANMLFE
ncbi:MAG: AAA family ATPase, partial [Candidatus Delongbacteria bacterium]|nr:AAA family ATPase [Candidatus Delongbacteria bacterium]